MDPHTKYRMMRTMSLLAILVTAYCFYKVIPLGIGGQVQEVKTWIGMLFITSSVGIGCALATYYYREKITETDNDRIRATTPGVAGTKQRPTSGANTHKTRRKSV